MRIIPSLTLLLFAHCWVSAPAAAADEKAVRELKELHEKLVKPDKVLPAERGKKAREQLDAWALDAADLDGKQRALLAQTQAFAALVAGDAAAALRKAEALLEDSGDQKLSQQVAFLAALAAGDARTADKAVEQLTAGTKDDEAGSIAAARATLKLIGRKAAEVTLAAADGQTYSTTQRGGRVLVLDFWSLDPKPAKKSSAALVRAYDTSKAAGEPIFVGVCLAPKDRVAAAGALAKELGYTWPVAYNGETSTESAAEELGASAGMQLILDPRGYIRFAGDAGEPAFHYALRAVLAEATNAYPAVAPITVDGDSPGTAELQPSEAAATPSKEPERAKHSSELPSNPEAASMLREARAFMKTGKKKDARRLLEQIIKDYPGTKEAAEAEEFLRGL
ncbi:hypothetical protein RAS1_34900 [Phycisphaerae bacterium RAS1]|nr:hypothetical protein RAS1_34900 [Phycisphaerae bacterium RAS1]